MSWRPEETGPSYDSPPERIVAGVQEKGPLEADRKTLYRQPRWDAIWLRCYRVAGQWRRRPMVARGVGTEEARATDLRHPEVTTPLAVLLARPCVWFWVRELDRRHAEEDSL